MDPDTQRLFQQYSAQYGGNAGSQEMAYPQPVYQQQPSIQQQQWHSQIAQAAPAQPQPQQSQLSQAEISQLFAMINQPAPLQNQMAPQQPVQQYQNMAPQQAVQSSMPQQRMAPQHLQQQQQQQFNQAQIQAYLKAQQEGKLTPEQMAHFSRAFPRRGAVQENMMPPQNQYPLQQQQNAHQQQQNAHMFQQAQQQHVAVTIPLPILNEYQREFASLNQLIERDKHFRVCLAQNVYQPLPGEANQTPTQLDPTQRAQLEKALGEVRKRMGQVQQNMNNIEGLHGGKAVVAEQLRSLSKARTVAQSMAQQRNLQMAQNQAAQQMQAQRAAHSQQQPQQQQISQAPQRPGSAQQNIVPVNPNTISAANFNDSLLNMMRRRGTPITGLPSLEGRQIDLFRLYKSVMERGGHHHVQNNGLWLQVALDNDIFIDPNSNPQGPAILDRLSHIYNEMLAPFEESLRQSRTVQPTLNRPNPQPTATPVSLPISLPSNGSKVGQLPAKEHAPHLAAMEDSQLISLGMTPAEIESLRRNSVAQSMSAQVGAHQQHSALNPSPQKGRSPPNGAPSQQLSGVTQSHNSSVPQERVEVARKQLEALKQMVATELRQKGFGKALYVDANEQRNIVQQCANMALAVNRLNELLPIQIVMSGSLDTARKASAFLCMFQEQQAGLQRGEIIMRFQDLQKLQMSFHQILSSFNRPASAENTAPTQSYPLAQQQQQHHQIQPNVPAPTQTFAQAAPPAPAQSQAQPASHIALNPTAMVSNGPGMDNETFQSMLNSLKPGLRREDLRPPPAKLRRQNNGEGSPPAGAGSPETKASPPVVDKPVRAKPKPSAGARAASAAKAAAASTTTATTTGVSPPPAPLNKISPPVASVEMNAQGSAKSQETEQSSLKRKRSFSNITGGVVGVGASEDVFSSFIEQSIQSLGNGHPVGLASDLAAFSSLFTPIQSNFPTFSSAPESIKAPVDFEFQIEKVEKKEEDKKEDAETTSQDGDEKISPKQKTPELVTSLQTSPPEPIQLTPVYSEAQLLPSTDVRFEEKFLELFTAFDDSPVKESVSFNWEMFGGADTESSIVEA